MATEVAPDLKAPVPAWRRLLVAAGWFALALLAICAAVALFTGHRLTNALVRLGKELDESDPGWRWPTPLEDRPDVPPAEDSAARLLALSRGLPRGWPAAAKWDALHGPSANAGLDGPRRAALNELLDPVAALRPQARELVRFPRGRIDVTLAEVPYATLLPNHQKVREVASLLHLDALDLAAAGRPAEALASARACLNASRVLEDDRFLIGQLVRCAVAGVAMSGAERTLGLGEAPDDALAALQQELAHEAGRTGLAAAMRGERAMADETLTLLSSGRVALPQIDSLMSGGGRGEWWTRLGWISSVAGRELARREHADVLRLTTALVEAAKLPAKDQFAAEAAIRRQAAALGAGAVGRHVVPWTQKACDAARRAQCQAAALRALIGTERYRQKHGGWPARLDDVVPAFLDRVPDDPIDGKPIRYARWSDGVVVYSVGNDRVDGGGDVEKHDKDFGYRLWDPAKRPAAPPPLPPGPGGPP